MKRPRARRVLDGKRLARIVLREFQKAARAGNPEPLTPVQRETLLEVLAFFFEGVYTLGLLAGQNMAIEQSEQHFQKFITSVRTPADRRPPRLAGVVDGINAVIGEMRANRIQREAALGTSEHFLKYPMRRAKRGE